MIGFAFSNNDTTKVNEETRSARISEEKAVISLVKVKFEDSHKVLDYYNDKFDLQEGDRVFVEGSMAGKIGEVISVSTHFKIKLKDYRKVIAHPTISFDGRFRRINDKMVATGNCCPYPEMFRSWVSCTAEDDEDVEIVTGEPFRVSLDGFGEADGISEQVFTKALEYCQQGRVAYLRLSGGKGTAFVRGTKWYELHFTVEGGEVDNIVCDCPYPYFCKHAVAVLITLKLLLSNDELDAADTFTAIDRDFFWSTLSSGCEEISL